MKIRKIEIRRSLILSCAAVFLLYSLILLAVYNGVNAMIYCRLNNAFPTMDNLMEYLPQLREETFSGIPLCREGQCGMMVFDSQGRTIYASSRRIGEQISATQIPLIPDYSDNQFYSVFTKITADGQKQYHIYRNSVQQPQETTQMTGSCVLDENYQVIAGENLFSRPALTEAEMGLLQGQIGSDWQVEKASYQTESGQERTVVLVTPQINAQTYDRTVSEANQLWLIAIPLMMLIASAGIAVLIRRIRRSLRPLNQAMESYQGQSAPAVSRKSIPVEFDSTVDRFSQLVERLSQAQQEKQRAYQIKQQMITDISHDLKTPLTVIQGYTRALLEQRIPMDRQMKILQTIDRRADQAVQLLDSLFEYVKMDHPGYAANRRRLDLSEQIRGILAEKYSEAQHRGFVLQIDLPEHPVFFAADEKLFRRLMENLLGNALRYNPAGTTLAVSLREKGDQIILTVADDGCGIPESIADRVFEPFVTGSAARSHDEGSGLGLSIVKRITELHEGSITLLGDPPEPFHTMFEMRFPAENGKPHGR